MTGPKPEKIRPQPAALPKPRLKPTSKPGRRARERRKVTVHRAAFELDYDALGRAGHAAWSRLVLEYVDWLDDRTCRHTLLRQLAGPCDPPERIVKRVQRAHWRSANTQRALDDVHTRCAAAVWPQQPGASRAIESCSGCVFSFPGSTGADDSLLDAFGRLATPRAREDQTALRARVAELGGRYAR